MRNLPLKVHYCNWWEWVISSNGDSLTLFVQLQLLDRKIMTAQTWLKGYLSSTVRSKIAKQLSATDKSYYISHYIIMNSVKTISCKHIEINWWLSTLPKSSFLIIMNRALVIMNIRSFWIWKQAQKGENTQ